MAQQHINLGTPPTGIGGDTPRTAFQTCEENFTELYVLAGTGVAPLQAQIDSLDGRTDTLEADVGTLEVTVAALAADRGAINGLRLVWNSGTSLTVSAGAAYIPGAGSLVELPAALTKASLSLTANTWYHAYLYLNGTTADVEFVTTSPAAAYWGAARAKAGDTSRRYIGSFRTGSTGAVVQFQHQPDANIVTWLGADYTLRNVLSAGSATTATNVSCAGMAPVTATHVDVLVTNVATAGIVLTGNSEQGLPLAAGAGNSYYGYVDPSRGVMLSNHPVNASQQLQYRYLSAPTGSGLYIDVNGYRFQR